MNMKLWDAVKKPPATALKPIRGGRIHGMTDISPQWRYQAMTEQFGPCGVGWKYTIDKLWDVPGSDGQVAGFAMISLFIKIDGQWSDPIPGVGGSMFVAKEKGGLYTSDEVYKMATTDALSVAMKELGVGAEIYLGRWDGSKYKDESPAEKDIPAKVGDWGDQIKACETAEDLRTIYKAMPPDQREAWDVEVKAKRTELGV